MSQPQAVGVKVRRPLIGLTYVEPNEADSELMLTHDGLPTRVVLRRNVISVGYTDVTPEALRHLLFEWEKKFGPGSEEVVLQP